MDAPFVLLDDARGGRARLFRAPRDVLVARSAEEVAALLDRLRGETRHAAGFLSYEAMEEGATSTGLPLAWFGLFDAWEPVDAAEWLPDPAGAWAGTPVPRIDRATYAARFAEVAEAIRAGEIYQANLSFPADVPVAGHPAALYAGLRARQRMAHGALLFTGDDWLLSLSPELFVAVEGDSVRARPMKGTAPPDAAPELLAGDEKQRAENLMIVDLMRNDLSRVAVPGSVHVPRLFAVERYPTVQQMVSDVAATLRSGVGPVDVIAAAFPCGSITGAPKRAAMARLRSVEQVPRGIYTGAIGHVSAQACDLNVAIRTLHIAGDGDRAVIGLGSGVVADSDADQEWAECLRKGSFVASDRAFDLIETMLFDANDGLMRLDLHIERMRQSARLFGYPFDRHDVRNELQAATFRLRQDATVRLLCGKSGAISVETRPPPDRPVGPVIVPVVPLPVAPHDIRLRHKTSDRAFYDTARRAAGAFEVLFRRPDGLLTEGSFTNLFVERGGTLLTPPLSRGLLPGVLRTALINEGRAVEADLTEGHLAEGFLIGNAVRGLLPARLASL
ncbi:para-aminobenzoate synthetase/4-amino-4-deoxychorismate lyase [Sphingomonas jejuensis]|uniref:Probable branched-chain-amino-acid aminotransferase n=1 Tax=Sphingomonas jejuensis TaxID=904715 RepID=A0ABX0XQB9_9SPHN|nr:chorismate-binding protein [Sphingomonas jejuensis]NJC34891.1 para-aminobenzoate synthetase/4-amino-4-deoxychorismate lyase [Sphingomonas jejuensis]